MTVCGDEQHESLRRWDHPTKCEYPVRTACNDLIECEARELSSSSYFVPLLTSRRLTADSCCLEYGIAPCRLTEQPRNQDHSFQLARLSQSCNEHQYLESTREPSYQFTESGYSILRTIVARTNKQETTEPQSKEEEAEG
jgi:hypothetical protein